MVHNIAFAESLSTTFAPNSAIQSNFPLLASGHRGKAPIVCLPMGFKPVRFQAYLIIKFLAEIRNGIPSTADDITQDNKSKFKIKLYDQAGVKRTPKNANRE